MFQLDNFSDESFVGSSIFFSSNTIIGKIVKLGGFFDRINGLRMNEFSHVGTIVMQENGRLGLLEALKPYVIINDLEERINTCEDKMVLCKLDDNAQEKIHIMNGSFKRIVKKYNKQPYNTLGALLAGIDMLADTSVLSKLFAKFRKPMHCSYLDAIIKQECCIIPPDINCAECTPQDNYNFNIYKYKVNIN